MSSLSTGNEAPQRSDTELPKIHDFGKEQDVTDMIGFYALVPTKDGKGHLGALLVTDHIGKPEEFRVTFPVRPTRVQRQLYGQALLGHIGVSLCGAPLYQSLINQGHVKLLLVSHSELLPIKSYASCLVVHVQRTGERFEVATGAKSQADVTGSVPGGFQPLTSTYPQRYTDEQKTEARQLTEKFLKNIDLVEPFDRIHNAITALAEEDERFR